MTSYNQGDVVLIPFPFTDFSSFKQRPAVVVSSDEFNRTHQDVVVAAITSHLTGQTIKTDYLLDIADLKPAGLPKASLIKLGKIVTIDQRLVHKTIGKLPQDTFLRVMERFEQVFGKWSS